MPRPPTCQLNLMIGVTAVPAVTCATRIPGFSVEPRCTASAHIVGGRFVRFRDTAVSENSTSLAEQRRRREHARLARALNDRVSGGSIVLGALAPVAWVRV
jgi:hypothetical protein